MWINAQRRRPRSSASCRCLPVFLVALGPVVLLYVVAAEVAKSVFYRREERRRETDPAVISTRPIGVSHGMKWIEARRRRGRVPMSHRVRACWEYHFAMEKAFPVKARHDTRVIVK